MKTETSHSVREAVACGEPEGERQGLKLATALLALACLVVPPNVATAADSPQTEADLVAEISFAAAPPHPKPFVGVTLDVVFTDPTGAQRTLPAFWAGGQQWKVR